MDLKKTRIKLSSKLEKWFFVAAEKFNWRLLPRKDQGGFLLRGRRWAFSLETQEVAGSSPF